MLAGLAAYNSSSSEEEDKQPVPTAEVKKQKKKILVPKAVQHSSDEEDEPATKKRIVNSRSKTGSGLFDKLPAPRNIIGTGKQANRTFIPHVFSKKPEQKSVTNTPLAKKPRSAVKDADSSGDEEEEINFFSFVDKPPRDGAAQSNEEISSTLTTNPTFSSGVTQPIIPQSSRHQNDYSVNPQPVHSNPAASMISHSGQQHPSVSDQATVPPQSYNTAYPNETHAHAPTSQPNAISSGGKEFSSWQQDDRFKRLQGKTNRREKVEFIEINADAALEGNKELLLKQISKEKNINRTSHSKKKNKDMPSSQSKRKHQMSYLIHQAKEREIELKNSWAEGRATRNAVRNRYGF